MRFGFYVVKREDSNLKQMMDGQAQEADSFPELLFQVVPWHVNCKSTMFSTMK